MEKKISTGNNKLRGAVAGALLAPLALTGCGEQDQTDVPTPREESAACLRYEDLKDMTACMGAVDIMQGMRTDLPKYDRGRERPIQHMLGIFETSLQEAGNVAGGDKFGAVEATDMVEGEALRLATLPNGLHSLIMFQPDLKYVPGFLEKFDDKGEVTAESARDAIAALFEGATELELKPTETEKPEK